MHAATLPPSGKEIFIFNLTSPLSKNHKTDLNTVLSVQVEWALQKTHFLLPPSTLDPSCVSSPSEYMCYAMIPVLLTPMFLSVLLFCIFHHAHLMEKHACYSLLSKTALVFGVISSVGSFAAGNCDVSYPLQKSVCVFRTLKVSQSLHSHCWRLKHFDFQL